MRAYISLTGYVAFIVGLTIAFLIMYVSGVEFADLGFIGSLMTSVVYSVAPYGLSVLVLFVIKSRFHKGETLLRADYTFFGWAFLSGLCFGLQYLIWFPTENGQNHTAVFFDDGIVRTVIVMV